MRISLNDSAELLGAIMVISPTFLEFACVYFI
jgi:hypothetical protein